MRLHDTLSRSVRELVPANEDGVIGLYTCGPTVYNTPHIGNYRTYVFEDVLRRSLLLLGYKVRHVMNITDVGHLTSDADEGQDKMEVGAAREGKSARDIARFYTQSFFDDIGRLNILRADTVCPATEHIPEQIALIRRLEERGVTYRTADGVYFDTAKFPGYGRLMGASHLAGIQEGARVQANPDKRNPSDFALWKLSPEGSKRQMEWDSPWGRGFPGWHIECSAMAMKYLGESFDIHCGGVDHIPVHHTNEIAQAEAATGKPFVRFWMHAEFLVMNKAKMAKSEGGFVRLADLEARGLHPLDYRCFCFGAHYRRQLEFSWEGVEAARVARRRFAERFADISRECGNTPSDASEPLARFRERLADDLNVPEAMAVAWDTIRPGAHAPSVQLGFLHEAEKVLALLPGAQAGERLTPELKILFDRYVESRKRKDFASSDALRKELLGKGVKVKDTPQGSVWSRV
ncbi:MAG: cysteine--tRNA ligase [Elusimicrobiota bacterium]